MKIDNLKNYPGIEANGVFSNAAEPLTHPNGSPVYLASNYAGLYGVVLGTLLVLVTDNYPLAFNYYKGLGRAS